MDWGRIKTIFIISFLLLDIYLAYQFINIRTEANYEFITEASIEEKLKNDDIKYSNLPAGLTKEHYVSARQKIFTPDELSDNQSLKMGTNEGALITGKLKAPVKIDDKFAPEEFLATVQSQVQFGDQYTFWKKDDDSRTITYHQRSDGKPMYNNMNARLVFYFNEDHEVEAFEQTYLVDIQELSEEQEILTPLGAIETLYKKGLLKPKTEITKVELGYATLAQLTASQVLAPTWRIVVNGEENLFVHAFEGQVIKLENNQNETTE